MHWLARTTTLLTALLLTACGSDATPGPQGASGDGSTGPQPSGTASSSESGEESSGSSTGGDTASPLDHEGCQSPLPAGEQTPAAMAIAASIEAEIDEQGRTDDLALVDFGIKLGQGSGGADIFCLSLVLHAEWFASEQSLCVQDIDPDVVLAEVSEVIAEAPTLPSFAPLADIEAAASPCIEAPAYVPCRGTLGFRQPTFDPNVIRFSTGEEDECTYTSRWATIDATTAEQLSCESDSTDTCDTEG